MLSFLPHISTSLSEGEHRLSHKGGGGGIANLASIVIVGRKEALLEATHSGYLQSDTMDGGRKGGKEGPEENTHSDHKSTVEGKGKWEEN